MYIVFQAGQKMWETRATSSSESCADELCPSYAAGNAWTEESFYQEQTRKALV